MWKHNLIAKFCLLFTLGAMAGLAGDAARQEPSGDNCSFRADPDAFLSRQLRQYQDVHERAGKLNRNLAVSGRLSVAPGELPRRNFIDVEIFDTMAKAGVAAARVSSDAEFFRRIHLDLTGRIPTPNEVRNFLADSSVEKRNIVIDRLLYSQEFTDKWTLWMGDLLENAQVLANVNRQTGGRNAYHFYIRTSIDAGKPLKDMVYELVTAGGNNYSLEEGASNFAVGGRAVMGPIQDTYDLQLYQTTSRFLGLGYFDCLLCHDGRRHMEQLSLWGTNSTRLDAQRMAAFFSRVTLATPHQQDRTSPLFNSWQVTDRPTGNYALNTNFGNRPNRAAVGNIRAVDAEYRNGNKPASGFWRAELAENIIQDPMMAVNFANRIWKQMFNLALVEPLDGLDPARLDPDHPPAAPWKLQATHPRLLRLLANALAESNYNLREYVRLVAESTAYQLSSRYDGEWNVTSVPLFARHFARRLEGEEVHDAIVKATGIPQPYTVADWDGPAEWAMQLPEPVEPRSNGNSLRFMNAFLRGNRDGQNRSQSGSILQALNLMNDAFVNNRVRVASSPTLRAISTSTDNAAAVDELFLLFLSRLPTNHEKDQAVAALARTTNATTRNTAIEDLAWALINKAEFIFSH
ncbi:MAG: DUF1553 domain-containing protein [Acidimicrobiia bacterium]|nr:DUF1553 domain-containing protein [Acidimicrobiia bacterium]